MSKISRLLNIPGLNKVFMSELQDMFKLTNPVIMAKSSKCKALSDTSMLTKLLN